MKTPLPSRPNFEQLKKQAKAILKGYQSGDPETLKRILKSSARGSRFTLADAQFVIAREAGFDSWTKLKAYVAPLEQPPATELQVNALRDAAGRGDLDRIKLLLDENPTLINESGGSGVRTALHQAVFGGQEGAVKLLLDRDADPNIRCEGDNAYPLHFAVEKHRFPIIRLLIERGADPIGEGDYHELGVIGWATAWEYIQADPEIVKYLLAHGARHNLWSAVAMGEVEIVRELVLRSPADLERRMDMANRRRRPLHLAVIKKQTAVLAELLDLGANTESLDEAGFSALDQAALYGETELAQLLLERGAKVRLPAAVALGRTRDVEKLLRRDPDVLKPGNRWEHLIIRASEHSSSAVIDALVQAGASVNVRDNNKTAVDGTMGYTALHAAGFHGNLSAAEALIRHGANVQAREEKYRATPIGWANYAGHTKVRDLLLREPVDLLDALEYGLTDRVRQILLRDPGALNRPFSQYPNYPTYAGTWFTPIVAAVTNGHVETARLLLELGADSEIRRPDRKGLIEIAEDAGHTAVGELLKGRIAKDT